MGHINVGSIASASHFSKSARGAHPSCFGFKWPTPTGVHDGDGNSSIRERLREQNGSLFLVFLVQKHYCDCVHSHLLSSLILGEIDETIDAGSYLVTVHLCADDFVTCCGPGLSGRKI